MAKKKWADYRSKLPALEQPPDFQARIDEAKLNVIGVTDGSNANGMLIAKKLVEYRRKKNKLEERVKALNPYIVAMEQLLVDYFDENQLENISTRSSITLSESPEPYCSIEDGAKFSAWIKADRSRAYLLSYVWSRVNSVVKEGLTKGEAPPPGIKIYLKRSITVRGL
jgi:hypothetical protein